jgi:hypothetical protein
VAVPYEAFERSVLRWLWELQHYFTDNRGHAAELREVEDQDKFLAGRIAEISQQLSQLGAKVAAVVQALADMEGQRTALRARIEELRRQQQAPTLADTQELLAKLASTKGPELQDLRRRTAQYLLQLLKGIDVNKVEAVPGGKRVLVTIRFQCGLTRQVWFESGREYASGMWFEGERIADARQFFRDFERGAGHSEGASTASSGSGTTT